MYFIPVVSFCFEKASQNTLLGDMILPDQSVVLLK